MSEMQDYKSSLSDTSRRKFHTCRNCPQTRSVHRLNISSARAGIRASNTPNRKMLPAITGICGSCRCSAKQMSIRFCRNSMPVTRPIPRIMYDCSALITTRNLQVLQWLSTMVRPSRTKPWQDNKSPCPKVTARGFFIDLMRANS